MTRLATRKWSSPRMLGLEDRRGRVERVDRRVDAFLGDRPRQHGGRVEVGEHRRRGRVGEVVGGHVDRLHRGDRALAGGGDALLQLAHLGLQRRLVADLGGHPPEQRRDLGAGLHEAEDVVDEQQHVLALVAEVFGHRQARQGDAHAGPGRLVHLPEHEHRLVDDARLLHLQPQVVALAGALADAAEGRQARRAPWRGCGSAPGSAPSCRRRRRRTARPCRPWRRGRAGRRP